jgi:hypothetical protein
VLIRVDPWPQIKSPAERSGGAFELRRVVLFSAHAQLDRPAGAGSMVVPVMVLHAHENVKA